MPDRLIRDSCKTSLTLANLSHGAERLFWRLTTVADNKGRFHAEVQAVLAAAFPVMLDRIKLREVAGWLGELRDADLIQCYEADNREFAVFTKWEKHQRVYAYSSKLPEPPVDSGNLRADNRSESRCRSESRSEKIKTSRSTKPRKPRVDLSVYPADFEEFWKHYPRKVHKGKALKAWNNLNGTMPALEQVIAAVDVQAKQTDWTKEYGRYIPYPGSWLNAHGWADEVKPYDPGDF